MGIDISVAGLVQVQLRKAVLSLKLFIQSTLSDFSGGLVMTHPARRVLKFSNIRGNSILSKLSNMKF